MAIRFGTDGWRAVIAEEFTFDNVRRCAQGVAHYLLQQGLSSRPLVVGYDTRFASEDFAAAVAEVLAGNGFPVLLADAPSPTPVVSYSVVARQAGGAVIITASHNPARWNGFKYRTAQGGSAPQEVLEALERFIAPLERGGAVQRLALDEAKGGGRVQMVSLAEAYLAHVGALVDFERLRDAGLRVVADAMYGAGAGYLPRILAGGKSQAHEIRGQRNPAFPGIAQPEPIAANLSELSEAVRHHGADVGLALDGDADRLGVVDEGGRYLTPLQVFALLAWYMLEVRKERGPLVKSLTSTAMIYRLGERYGVPVHETPVGFKHIAPVMLSQGALIGGEESGGYAFRGHIPERDGVLSGLLVLDLMVRTGKKPSELLEELYRQVGPHHYDRLDIHFPGERRAQLEGDLLTVAPEKLAGLPVVQRDNIDGLRFLLERGAWLVIRFSGTEPLLRIYAEGEHPLLVQELLRAGRELVGL